MLKIILYIVSLVLPWQLRWRYLNFVFGYKISPSARIGFSLVLLKTLEMKDQSRIGNLTVIKGLDNLDLGQCASIGNLNWITGFSKNQKKHFSHIYDRDPSLIVGNHSAITNRHLIDCTDKVELGSFTTFAGFRSQILTHSIELNSCKQGCKPVYIGNYCFIGTGTVILGGASLPDYCVLGAASLLIDKQQDKYSLYGGVPARSIKKLPESYEYFKRQRGFVD